ncbi:DUF4192 domain-containing protein [Kutzneria buriramensis]|uniref:Uncharacterized protein DUF4192 n=1 Tax=Kutzneria buriramensis TaxID=1045776 RepID=A0A3E0GWF9_9PSEU|nr:DUF4192 domain-containing protein [Kutzneria buriramensis]REH28647.1 uncharacterized protein DUF4192 [Kutzneria buriramensis]
MSVNDAARTDDLRELVLSVPALLGCHPTRSLIVVGCSPAASAPVVLRADLFDDERLSAAVYALVDAAARAKLDHAHVVIVEDVGADIDRPPRPHVIKGMRALFAGHGINLWRALWASSTQPGGLVLSYDDHLYRAVLPAAPEAPPVVAAHADTAALLAGADPVAVRRRDALLNQLVTLPNKRSFADMLALVEHAVRAPDEIADDHRFVALAEALSDHGVRDACLAFTAGEHAEHAERLWHRLVRGLPAPERAEPAVLLAIFAYLRDDRALAHLAASAATQAVEQHQLARWVLDVIHLGVPADQLRAVCHQAADEARRQYGQSR